MELLHPAMSHVAVESWHWICQVAAPCSVPVGSGMTCHRIRPNVRHIAIQHLVSSLTISPVNMLFCTSLQLYPNRTTSAEQYDVMSISKMANLLDLRGPIMACIKPLAVASGGWSRSVVFFWSFACQHDDKCFVDSLFKWIILVNFT